MTTMPDITHADLIAMQGAITDTVRYEVSRAEAGIHERIAELKVTQLQHGKRLDRIEERTKSTGVLDLTPSQKKVLWTAAAAVGAAVLEGLRHLLGVVVPWVASGARHP
jgi:hypothetical protein